MDTPEREWDMSCDGCGDILEPGEDHDCPVLGTVVRADPKGGTRMTTNYLEDHGLADRARASYGRAVQASVEAADRARAEARDRDARAFAAALYTLQREDRWERLTDDDQLAMAAGAVELEQRWDGESDVVIAGLRFRPVRSAGRVANDAVYYVTVCPRCGQDVPRQVEELHQLGAAIHNGQVKHMPHCPDEYDEDGELKATTPEPEAAPPRLTYHGDTPADVLVQIIRDLASPEGWE